MDFICAAPGSQTIPTTVGTPLTQDSSNPMIVHSTTADEAGEITRALTTMETKYAETCSLLRLYQNITNVRIGTNDLENQAKAMASQEHNNRGSIFPKVGTFKFGGGG